MEKPWLNEYDSGVPATIDYPQVPVQQFLVDAATKFPDKTALVYGNVVEPLGNALMDTSMTYGRLLELTNSFAAALQQLGVQKGTGWRSTCPIVPSSSSPTMPRSW